MQLKIYRYILIPFSFVYYFILLVWNIFYKLGILKAHKLDCKVISVGNITWGGTGKTPSVLFISEELLKRNSKFAILIRGYGKDETSLLSRLKGNIPIIVGRDRVKNGLEAIKKHSVGTILLDDGFQYRNLKRDLDIVCIDATNPFGNNLLIPVGSMRENSSSLKRADIFLITKSDLVKDGKTLNDLRKKLVRINPKAVVVESNHGFQDLYEVYNEKIIDIKALRDKEVILLSAIGSPHSFEKTVLNQNLKINKHFIFRDHHNYKKKDLEKIENYCKKRNIKTVITTEKDAIKLKSMSYKLKDINFVVFRIKLYITQNEEGFFDRLFGIYNS